MFVISVLNQKGGVGKTTIATNLAIMFLQDQYRTLLLSADSQGSADMFVNIRKENSDLMQIDTIRTVEPVIHGILNEIDYDVIIIDVAGHEDKTFRNAAAVSDMILVPYTPSQFDIDATERTLDFLHNTVRKEFPDIKILTIINQVVRNTKLSHEINKIEKGFSRDFNVIPIKTRLHFYVDYKESIAHGKSTVEFKPSHVSATEIKSMYKEIKKNASKKT